MKSALTFRATLLVAILFAAQANAQAPAAAPGAAEGRQATRCAVFYLLMSQVPAMAANKERLEGLADGLGKIASNSGASNEDLDKWAKEYMNEAVENAKASNGNFNQVQSTTCESFLARREAMRADEPAPAPGPNDKVDKRHPSGRPASILALGKKIAFDDGAGDSCSAPVVMTNASDKSARIRSQYVWLDDVHPGWKLLARATRFDPEPNEGNIDQVRIYSWFSLQDRSGKPFEACFDATQDMLPQLKALSK